MSANPLFHTRISNQPLKDITPRNSAAKAIKNMQVPMYCPSFAGVQASEKSGVEVEVKNVMLMSAIPIMGIALDMPEELVDGMDMPELGFVAICIDLEALETSGLVAAIVVLDISIPVGGKRMMMLLIERDEPSSTFSKFEDIKRKS